MRATLMRACLATVLAMAVACADDSGENKAGPSGFNATGVTVTRVEITGPASIPQGQSVQYSAVARMSDGSTREPKTVTWATSQPALFRVSASGLVTAEQLRGEAALNVDVAVQGTRGPVRGTREILVMPDGTFRLLAFRWAN